MVQNGNALAALRSAGLPFIVRGASMPVLPKPFFVLRTLWQTARMARRLNRANTDVPAQQQIFRRLLENIASTASGRDLGITAALSYEEFRARVPLRDHAQLEPYFRRIKRGEPNVLWPGDCRWYVESAGTTGTAKWLPVTAAALAHFEQAEAASLLYYSARVGHTGVFRGRHLSIARSLALSPIDESKLPGSVEPSAHSVSAPTSPTWGAPQLAEPGDAMTEISEWPARIEAIITRTLRLDITLLAGIPNWLLEFADAVRGRAIAEKMSALTLKAIWPNLECLVHHGIPVGPFHDELKRAAGPAVNFHEVYFAAEAFIAAQDADSALGLRLICDAGVFYEFLPLRDFDESLPLTLGAKALPLEQVRTGESYVLLLTTPAGLCRYVPGDIVQFISTSQPRLICMGRTQQRLNSVDENVLEKELTDSIVAVCQRRNWTITNFHVAPLPISSLTGQTRGRYEWWIELRPGTTETPTGPILAAQLDAELQARSESYAAKRQRGHMEPPVARLVMPGLFAHWMRFQSRWGGQKKMPRCRNDRLVADELSALACFTADN